MSVPAKNKIISIEAVRLCPALSGCFQKSRTASRPEHTGLCGLLSGLSGCFSIASHVRPRARKVLNLLFQFWPLEFRNNRTVRTNSINNRSFFVFAVRLSEKHPDRAGQSRTAGGNHGA